MKKKKIARNRTFVKAKLKILVRKKRIKIIHKKEE